MSEGGYEAWVVDRVASDVVVLVEDQGPSDDVDGAVEEPIAVIEVAAALLGELAVEGAVLRVPLGEVGEPVWTGAQRDEEAERRRRREAEIRLEKLRRRDPGGDIVL